MKCSSGLCTCDKKWIKTKMKTSICHILRGMKSSHDVHSTYDCVFFWTTIIVACVVVDIHCTIYVWVVLVITMSIKVQKLSLVIRISIRCWVWQGKRWETFHWTCAPFSKTTITIVFQSVLWVVICSFSQRHWNKWVLRSSMVWPHWCRKK